MVAPNYCPTESSPPSISAVQDDAASASGNADADERRRQILDKLLQQATELRLQGNQAFKKAQLDQAEVKYSQAIHMLQKIPGDMAAPDLVKSLNNRSRVYVKLDKMEQAEIDASEVLSMNSVERAATSAAFFVRYHARTGLGAPEHALGDLKRSAGLGNADAKKLLHSLTKTAKASGSAAAAANSNISRGFHSDSNPFAAAAAAVAGGYDSSRQARGPPATTARAAAAATAAARRRARGATAAAAAKKNGAERERLRARPGAKAGEELSFGGGANDNSPYGRRPVGGGGGCSSDEEEGSAKPLEVPGKRRPRPRPTESSNSGGGDRGSGSGSGKAASTFSSMPAAYNSTNNNKNNGGGAEAAVEETDTSPPPHSTLKHPSVRRCLLPSGGGAVAAGATAAGHGLGGGGGAGEGGAAQRGEAEKKRSCGSGEGERNLAAGDGGTGEAQNGRSSSGREESSGGAAGGDCDEGGGHGADEETAAVRGVAASDGDIAAPPPARQAQLVRWLVAQAKEQKHCREGEIWAVLDKKWWGRWQLYAGCSEDVADAAADADASAKSVVGRVERDAPTGAAAGSAGAAAAAEDTADDVAATPAAAAESSGNRDDGGDSATAEDGPTAAPPCVSVGVGGGGVGGGGVGGGGVGGGGGGVGGGGGGGKGGGRPAAKAGGEAQISGDAKAATAEATPSSGSPAPHPGPIDNSELVLGAGTPGTIPGTGRRLRLRLVRGYHFVLVPQEAWIALHAWYGGGPALPRALVSVRDSDSGDVVFEPQLYPEFSRLDPVLRLSRGGSSSSGGSSSGYADGSGSNGPDAAVDTAPGDGRVLPPPAEKKESAVEQEGLAEQREAVVARPEAGTPVAAAAASAAGDREPKNSDGGGVGASQQEGGAGGVAKGEGESRRKVAAAAAVHPCAACGLPAGEKCNSCFKTLHRVWYCSRACQKAHWRFHRRFCGGKDSEAGVALAKRGKAGLDNLGNTCFLNSAVQCLSHVQPLTRHVLSNAFREDVNVTNPLGTGGRLVQAYEQVLKDLWFGSRSSVSPAGLKSAIAKFAPQFNGYSQQDSQEVLSFLLDGLHEDLNRVPKKPYLTLPDGECGRPDSIIAAESWKLFSMRDRSVLVESLYGQFKSTLECGECGKLSRKFDEFNVMPVELLDGQRLHVVLDFAPLLNPSAAPAAPATATTAATAAGAASAAAAAAAASTGGDGKVSEGQGEVEGASCPRAAWLLSGERTGAESRKQRRVGVLLPKESLVSDLKAELSEMFDIAPDEMVIVVVLIDSRKAAYRVLPDSAEVLPYTHGYDITAHECVPGQRHALVVNRTFEGGRHVATQQGTTGVHPLARWAEEVSALNRLRHEDRDAPFLASFPEDVSCLGLLEIIWDYMRDYLHLTKQEYDDDLLGHTLASSGYIKVSEASEFFASYQAQQMADGREAYRQDRLDAENGVVVTEIGRYIPPTDAVRAAAVLDTCLGGRRQQQGVETLDFLHLDWCGFLLDNLNESRIREHCFGRDNHPSLQETTLRAKRVSLQDCLEKFSVPETLCEDNSWYCSRCKELRQAVKTIQVWSLPEVLILHFKRFSNAGPNRGKVELFVDFPINGLDMSPYCRGETLEGGRPMSALYDLFAVSNHMGGMGHGHYTAFVRDWEGGGMSERWHVCDDHDCRPVADESRVRSAHAYVLFYRRRPLA